MTDVLHLPYQYPETHVAVSEIIRRHSSNPVDIRKAVLANLDLVRTASVLDLGCGFGFMTEAVARKASPHVKVTGIDICQSNEKEFRARLQGRAGNVEFQCRQIKDTLSQANETYDAVVSSYSLYFFPEILSEIARVLKPNGLFLAVTHSEQNCFNLLSAVGVVDDDSVFSSLIQKFSGENGREYLNPYFQDVEQRKYQNTLRFEVSDLDDFVRYLEFKLPLFGVDPYQGKDVHGELVKKASTYLRRLGVAKVQKDDAVFICRGKRWS